MTSFSPAMRDKSSLTSANFEGLLLRLDPDRNLAGERYEEVRWKLIKFFQWSACIQAEDLADETFNRVAENIAADKEAIRDVVAFTWGIAKRVRQEALRRDIKTLRLPDVPVPEGGLADRLVTANSQYEPTGDEARLKCLRVCLKCLSAGDRKLLLAYYSPRGRRIEARRRLALESKMTALNLRVRANRLRFKMEGCLKKCLASKAD
jgi:DNA-directed RNA polymerase specialized sigma24 family protein